MMLHRRLIGTFSLALLLCAALNSVQLYAADDTRLANAAMQGDKGAVQSLLKQKADVNAALGDGMTALHWAAFHDDLELVKILLQAGANVKATTRLGAMTPLFMASNNGNPGMIEVLLKAGAEPNT